MNRCECGVSIPPEKTFCTDYSPASGNCMTYGNTRETANSLELNGHRADRCPERIDVSRYGDGGAFRYVHGKCNPKPARGSNIRVTARAGDTITIEVVE